MRAAFALFSPLLIQTALVQAVSLLTDWVPCFSNGQCINGCCSKQYSNDGVYKCTPGGTLAQCTGAVGLGDWAFCGTNANCVNRCCSKQYSNDGKYKCTPGGTLSQCTGDPTLLNPPVLTTTKKNFGGTTLINWGGVNSYYLHTLPDATVTEIVNNLKTANVKVIRLFITNVWANSKGAGNPYVPDIEQNTVGTYDPTQLRLINNLMSKTAPAGIKLIIALHDRWALGCWQTDAYVAKYRLPITNCATTPNNPSNFYTNAAASTDFKNRMRYIINFTHPGFGGRTWAQIPEAILSFEIQNESQGHMPMANVNWLCDQATFLRPLVNSQILISTGAGATFAESLHTAFFTCPAIDIVDLHSYDTSLASFQTGLSNAVRLGTQYNKLIIMEEFGRQARADKPTWINSIASLCNSLKVPWLPWQVMKPGNSAEFEFYTDDAPTWSNLTSLSSKALLGTK